LKIIEPIKESRKKVNRLKELLDKYMKGKISIVELEELRNLLAERYKNATSLAEATALAALYTIINIKLSYWVIGISPAYPRLDDEKFRQLIKKLDELKWERDW